jgi:RNA polymerase sigma factor (sigma-70 family)
MADTSKQPPPQDQDARDVLAAHATPLYAQSGADRWRLNPECFRAALARCISKALPAVSKSALADSAEVERLLAALHLEDLALACACVEGNKAAWEYFVATYRPYLRSAAAVILRRPGGSPEALDLADSLFAELYGMAEGKPSQGSLFRYFHGRSSLKTWLRAVLAQRHIDRIRASRRFTDLDDGEASAVIEQSAPPRPALALDPHRDRYLQMFRRALHSALGSLERRDALRLTLYYRDDQTLAEIGRRLGEHESSVSRNLDRVRRSIRAAVEAALRAGFPVVNGSPAEPGMSDAEIGVCFDYAAEDSGINLDTLFPSGSPTPAAGASTTPAPGKKQP